MPIQNNFQQKQFYALHNFLLFIANISKTYIHFFFIQLGYFYFIYGLLDHIQAILR